MRRRSVLVSAAAAATLPATAVAQQAAGTAWRVQALYSPGNQVWDELSKFTGKVRALSGGRLAIQLLPAGGAVAVGGTLDAVRAGVLDGHVSDPSLWNGIDPGFGTLGNFPGSFDTFYQLANYYYDHGGINLLRELYAPRGIYAVGVATGGPEALVSNKPLPNVGELKGLKVRSSPGISAQVFQKLGAGAVNIPFAEVFSALDKSIVDAADAGSLSFNDQIGLYAKSKHVVLDSPHSVAVMDFSVNQARWNALPADLKEILQVCTRDLFFSVMSRVEADDAKVRAQAAQKGLKLWTWDADSRGKYRAAALEVWNEWGAKAPAAKKVVDHQVAYLKSMGLL
jgi:TRAP-type mannitol/chloroaromatic compound transport system substrate-binding protein